MSTTPPALKPNEYRCAMCRGVFQKAWTDAEAKAEMERDYGDVPVEMCDVICDHCYQKVRPDTHPHEYESYKAAKN